jgi:predicted enzyme related to lactoylglutathione lyase
VEFERYDHGVPSWVDLASPDLDKSKAFYGALFGWETPDGPPEAGGYSVCLLRGKTVAGLSPKMDPNQPTVWLTYVDVASADETAEKAASSGGTVILAPMDVLDVGRLALIADPPGAVVGIWQAKTHPGAQLANEPNTLCWNELITTDLDASNAFYKAVFGWDAADQGPEGQPPAYTEWKLGDRSIGGMMRKTDEMPADMPPSWGVYFGVEDTDAAVAKVQELGGSLFMGPMDIEPGRFAVVSDDVGGVFNVIALKG